MLVARDGEVERSEKEKKIIDNGIVSCEYLMSIPK